MALIEHEGHFINNKWNVVSSRVRKWPSLAFMISFNLINKIGYHSNEIFDFGQIEFEN